MKAFVKTNNGTFPNVNFFLAWEAFNTMGYFVTTFEFKDSNFKVIYAKVQDMTNDFIKGRVLSKVKL